MFVSLKQSIVIVNEYTVKTKNGGSRGGTPGQYVTRYMCRDGAVEGVTPVRMEDSDDISMKYRRRRVLSDKAESVPDLKQNMKKSQGFGGMAFGNNDPSLSHNGVLSLSDEIQDAFDNGKTVMKTVLSFSEEYLRENNIISPDFEWHEGTGYRGSIDQMKLRLAVMNGLDKMSSRYDDLRYIGTIQVDTGHVHCHLAMYDRGRGTIEKGIQRGLLRRGDKNAIRRGIDMFLDESHSVQFMSSNIDHDKRNVTCFVKKFTHKAMEPACRRTGPNGARGRTRKTCERQIKSWASMSTSFCDLLILVTERLC